jgi:hypothetical protein
MLSEGPISLEIYKTYPCFSLRVFHVFKSGKEHYFIHFGEDFKRQVSDKSVHPTDKGDSALLRLRPQPRLRLAECVQFIPNMNAPTRTMLMRPGGRSGHYFVIRPDAGQRIVAAEVRTYLYRTARALRGQCATRRRASDFVYSHFSYSIFVMDFDTEKFSLQVKQRPAVWDLSSDEYSNKNLKKNMWEEITMVFGGSECTTTKEKMHRRIVVSIPLMLSIILFNNSSKLLRDILVKLKNFFPC